MDLLFVPGWNGSGPTHWQSLWQTELGGRRLEQDDWANPEPDAWVRKLDEQIARERGPVILVAHSLGALTVSLWAARCSPADRVAGAFLVAPPDPSAGCPVIGQFREQVVRLPFPTLVAGSENDPYATAEAVTELSRCWGARYWNAGRCGHINVASGHGEWPEGKRRLLDFVTGAD